MYRQILPVPVLAAACALLLSGCAANAPATPAVFHREATAEDVFPAGLAIPEDPLMENVRLLADVDGVRYYGAISEGPAAVCLVKVPDNSQGDFIAGCGSSAVPGRIVTVSGAGGTAATFVTDGFETKMLEDQGWRKVQENVLIGPSQG
jgi:hypothetical protein